LEFWFSLKSYLQYRLKARGANSLHSPFVFEFFQEVLQNPYNFYAFEEIENLRDQLLLNKKQIEFQSLGAKKEKVKSTVSNQARKSLLPVEKAIFLFQLAYWLKPKTVVELGTCMGVTTAYLAKAHPSKIFTFEGISQLAEIATEVWDELQIPDIELISGDIDQTLPFLLEKEKPEIDLAFVDANHTYEATLRYFHLLKNQISVHGCLVFDDIYWSSGMAKAWEEIKADQDVTVSIDVYHFGLVFFRKESQKENFIIQW
jgi:predicted O-methyltransferase YrrM